MRIPRILWLAGIITVVALFAFACGGDDDDDGDGNGNGNGDPTDVIDELLTDFGVSDTEIKLGFTLAQSGNPSAAAYSVIATAIQASIDKVNAEDGGACNRQIRLLVEDDQYDPALALEQATKLAVQDGVLGFIGNLGTPAVSGQVDFINDPNGDGDTSDGIPHLFLSTGASKWDDPEKWPWTVGYIPDYQLEASVIGRTLNEQFPGATAAILYQNDDVGEDGREGLKEVFEGEILAEQSYEAGATEVTSQLANLRDADPDILVIFALPLTTASVFRYMSANDWDPQVTWGYINPSSLIGAILGGGTEPDQFEAGYAQIAGVISTNYILDPINDPDDPAIIEHLRVMETYGGPPPNQLAVYGNSMADLAVHSLNLACASGDLTRKGLMNAVESIDGYRSDLLLPGIEISISSDDHAALQSLQPVRVALDGSLEPLGDLVTAE